MSQSLDDIESLYISEYRRLERIAARRVGASSAADVVQEVFAALWARTGGGTYSPAYLSGATKFAAVDHYRAERRRNLFLRTITEEQYATPAPLPDQTLAARQDLAALMQALALLPDRTRQVFLLNRMHHCTYDEIAEALGLSYSTVEREIARAIMSLRAALA
ncbi:RNA polymerase sigma factor [Xanthobacteraceae bacterium A53D]